MSWLNPVWWWASGKEAWKYAILHPAGAAFIFALSGVQTFWTTGFLTSLAHPNWARDVVTHLWPHVKGAGVALGAVVGELLNTT